MMMQEPKKMPLRILAIDPGVQACHAVLIEHRGGLSASVRMAKKCDATPSGIYGAFLGAKAELLRCAITQLDAIAIEHAAGGIYDTFRGEFLLLQNQAVGMVRMLAHYNGVPIVRMRAETWRKQLTGKSSSRRENMDKIVGDAVFSILGTQLATGHLNDAFGLGIVAGWALERGLVTADGLALPEAMAAKVKSAQRSEAAKARRAKG